MTWYEHSNAGYAQFRQLTVPENPTLDGPFNYLPWEEHDAEGDRVATRQEVDWPLQLGPVKAVPYVMGEAAQWGEDQAGQPLSRLWGQAGIRATLPMWSVDPTVSDDLLNIHGIAHKINFVFEFSTARPPSTSTNCRSTIRWTTTRSRPGGGSS